MEFEIKKLDLKTKTWKEKDKFFAEVLLEADILASEEVEKIKKVKDLIKELKKVLKKKLKEII